tara:strand:+ start:19287 stop:19901 length:615 start_codon:yes stop_codon:yes gene_type:complete
MKETLKIKKRRPIVLIHGLWNSSMIFKQIFKVLDRHKIEYYAPNLIHKFGMVSIKELAKSLNNEILNQFGLEKEIDIVGFSMGGIIGRYWIQKFEGYKRTKNFISIGSPHNGTLTAQLVPKFPLKGISEMKINSKLLNELALENELLENIVCTSFFTIWDLMVFPGWKAHLPIGEKYSLNVIKHKSLLRNPMAVNKIVDHILNQ